MKIRESGVALSRIVQIGSRLAQLERETGERYLALNRGVNAVVGIDLREVVAGIDFNARGMQTYPPAAGMPDLREAIAAEYFGDPAEAAHVLVTAGGMNALDLVLQTLDVGRLYLPAYHWGSYGHIATIRGVEVGEYGSRGELAERIDELCGSAVLLCDPGNPLGEKYDDDEQLALVRRLSDADVAVIVDCPYRRVFAGAEDGFYARLARMPNVVITESFSKSVGLSGQRIGFVHASDPALRDELAVRLMYCTNGVNAFAQQLVLRLLATSAGRRAVDRFKLATQEGIARNIAYLRGRGLLATEFYTESEPRGIFVIVNRSEDELLARRIGSVGLSFFTRSRKAEVSGYARICVSVPHDDFVRYFSRV